MNLNEYFIAFHVLFKEILSLLNSQPIVKKVKEQNIFLYPFFYLNNILNLFSEAQNKFPDFFLRFNLMESYFILKKIFKLHLYVSLSLHLFVAYDYCDRTPHKCIESQLNSPTNLEDMI